MTLRDTLLPGALLALCWGLLLASAQGPTPLQSLRCYNDYTSRIRCRWAESPGARRLLGLTLLRRLNADPPQPVSCERSDDLSWTGAPCPSCVSRECEIPHTLFVLADYDYFSFRPNRPLGAKLDLTLAQHVQPPTPTDLQVSAGPDSFLLTWNVTQSPWLSSLEFEVAYRRLQDSWEDASTVYASSPRVVLARRLLPPGTYLAWVRARLAPGSRFSGQPSGWSAAVPWDSPAGDEAQPHNLQCLFDGTHALRCSWDVHAEVARALPFSLFYRPGPGAAEEECAPVWQEPRGSGYTRHRCEIRVPAPEPQSRYTVSVRPRGEEKLIKSSDNIQIARPALSVARAGDGYGLNWTAERLAYEHISLTFQVQYKTEEAAWEDTEAESLQNARSMALPPLAPGTRYQARVRVKPTSNGYNGVWSEWSKESVWDTEWVLPTWGLVLILVLLTLASVPALRFCGVYGYRLNRKWEEKIPNPAKSLLFQNGGAGLRLPVSRRPPHQGPGPGLLSALQGVISGDLGRSEVSPLTTEDPGGARAAPAEPAPPPASPGTPQSPRPPGLHFNGPYLGLPHSRSLPNLGDLLAPPQPRPSGSLDYLCVPPAGQGRSGPPLGPGASPGDSRPPAAAASAGGPAPDYVTGAHLTLCPAPGVPAPDQAPRLGPGPPGGAPLKPGFGDYVELPPAPGHAPGAPLPSPGPPRPGEPCPAPPHPEELLVLQQVGDYCFLPDPAPAPPPDPCPPAPAPDAEDPALPSKKPRGPAAPQLPAIQLFKALKQQEYLALPAWDGGWRRDTESQY